MVRPPSPLTSINGCRTRWPVWPNLTCRCEGVVPGPDGSRRVGEVGQALLTIPPFSSFSSSTYSSSPCSSSPTSPGPSYPKTISETFTFLFFSFVSPSLLFIGRYSNKSDRPRSELLCMGACRRYLDDTGHSEETKTLPTVAQGEQERKKEKRRDGEKERRGDGGYPWVAGETKRNKMKRTLRAHVAWSPNPASGRQRWGVSRCLKARSGASFNKWRPPVGYESVSTSLLSRRGVSDA